MRRFAVTSTGALQTNDRGRGKSADQADSLDHIPMRYLLAFTAVVIATAREYLAAKGAPPEQHTIAADAPTAVPAVWVPERRRRRHPACTRSRHTRDALR